jgi:glycerate 2-kinase
LDRAQKAGLDVTAHFTGFNSFPLFEELGDGIQTGPTGNNVRDLRVLLAY